MLCTVKVTGELSIPVATKAKPDANRVECSFAMDVGQGQYCKVKANDLMKESCTHETNYGFETGTPCLLLKLNRVSHQGPASARGHICELVLFIS